MAIELFANNYVTSLASNATSGATTISVSGAPPSALTAAGGQFRLIIDSEILLCTAVSGTTLTVTRGQEGTSANTHAAGANVSHILTSGSLAQRRANTILSGAVASLPAAGTAGRAYLTTDDSYLFVDNGTTWSAFGPIVNLTPPVFTGYSWLNQGTATFVANTNGSGKLSAPNQNIDSLRVYAKAIPAAPYTFTAGITCNYLGSQPNNRMGLILLNGLNAGVDFALFSHASMSVINGKWNSLTSYNSDYYSAPNLPIRSQVWFLQISDDGTNRTFSHSVDGINFTKVFSTLNTDFITPTQIGFYINPNVSGGQAGTMTIVHLVG